MTFREDMQRLIVQAITEGELPDRVALELFALGIGLHAEALGPRTTAGLCERTAHSLLKGDYDHARTH